MDASVGQQTTRLHVRTSLYAHRVMIALCGISFALLGIAVSGALPTSYVATGSVLIQPLDGNPYAPNAQGSDLTNLETEAQVVASDVIATAVAEELRAENLPVNARKGLRIAVAPNTQIIQIGYAGGSARVVERTAELYAETYLDFRTQRRDAFVDVKREDLSVRIDELSTDLRNLRNREERAADDPEVRAIGAQQTNLRLQLAGLDTAESNPGEIIAVPQATISGFNISWQQGGLAGLLVGLALGAILALVAERRSERLRSIDDIEHLGVPVLGIQADPDAEDAAFDEADGEPLYDVANLAGTILNRRGSAPATVAVSSLSGTSLVTSFVNDLAQVLAHGREGVLLIDAASDTPTKTAGFSEVLAGRSELKPALVKRVRGKPIDPVARLLIGKNPAGAQALFSTSRMSDALEAASEEYNWVLVESPSNNQTSGRAVVGACRYWIPIVELGVSSRRDLERGLAWARATGVETLGVVVVDSPMNIFGRAKPRELEPDEQ